MSAYENYLARAWERTMVADIEVGCRECDAPVEMTPAAYDRGDTPMCGDCWDRAHCETCNGTGQIGAPWSPDSCPECPAPGKPLTNPQPF